MPRKSLPTRLAATAALLLAVGALSAPAASAKASDASPGDAYALPMQILGRFRSDRVMRRPTPPRVHDPRGGRPAKCGGECVFGDPSTGDTEVEGTVVRLVVEKLPSGGVDKPVWLWWSGTGATKADVDRCRQSFLCRFDIEASAPCAWTVDRPHRDLPPRTSTAPRAAGVRQACRRPCRGHGRAAGRGGRGARKDRCGEQHGRRRSGDTET